MSRDYVSEVTRPDSRTLKDLLAYWDALGDRGRIPYRSELDPVDIPNLLSSLFLVEVVDEGRDFRFRLAGEDVCRLHGQSLRGKSVADILSPEISEIVREQYLTMIRDPRPRFFKFRILTEDGRYWSYERALLPLRDASGAVTTLLGGVGGVQQV